MINMKLKEEKMEMETKITLVRGIVLVLFIVLWKREIEENQKLKEDLLLKELEINRMRQGAEENIRLRMQQEKISKGRSQCSSY